MNLTWKAEPIPLKTFPVTGPFAATFAPWSQSRPHMGVDFGTDWSASPVVPIKRFPVRAAYDGYSVKFQNDGSFGIGFCQRLQVDEGPLYSLYAHLDELTVGIGEYVDAGTVVGFVGKTGTSAEHLHWQLCRNSNFPRDLMMNLDPLKFPFQEDTDLPEDYKAIVRRIVRVQCGNGLDDPLAELERLDVTVNYNAFKESQVHNSILGEVKEAIDATRAAQGLPPIDWKEYA